jgi:hypothetical protein
MAEYAKSASPGYAFGDFVLERAQQEVRRRDGSPLNLSPRLFNALLLFRPSTRESCSTRTP